MRTHNTYCVRIHAADMHICIHTHNPQHQFHSLPKANFSSNWELFSQGCTPQSGSRRNSVCDRGLNNCDMCVFCMPRVADGGSHSGLLNFSHGVIPVDGARRSLLFHCCCLKLSHECLEQMDWRIVQSEAAGMPPHSGPTPDSSHGNSLEVLL